MKTVIIVILYTYVAINAIGLIIWRIKENKTKKGDTNDSYNKTSDAAAPGNP